MTVAKSAVLSPCGGYRYRLSRRWSPGGRPCLFVMLNPSTADHENDDPTVRRCIGFARTWGFGELWIGNLFAGRTPSPAALKRIDDPVGPGNHEHLAWMADYAQAFDGIVVAAWGAHGSFMRQDDTVRGWFGEWAVPLHSLRLTAGGAPAHPLYLPGDLTPQVWR